MLANHDSDMVRALRSSRSQYASRLSAVVVVQAVDARYRATARRPRHGARSDRSWSSAPASGNSSSKPPISQNSSRRNDRSACGHERHLQEMVIPGERILREPPLKNRRSTLHPVAAEWSAA